MSIVGDLLRASIPRLMKARDGLFGSSAGASGPAGSHSQPCDCGGGENATRSVPPPDYKDLLRLKGYIVEQSGCDDPFKGARLLVRSARNGEALARLFVGVGSSPDLAKALMRASRAGFDSVIVTAAGVSLSRPSGRPLEFSGRDPEMYARSFRELENRYGWSMTASPGMTTFTR